MKTRYRLFLPSLLAVLLLWFPTHSAVSDLAGPPPSRVEVVRETLHGVEILDSYRWLEDQKSPETRSWIDAQNRYTRTLLDQVPGREGLKRRLEELLQVDKVRLPVVRGKRQFFLRRLATQDLSVLAMREGASARDEVLVDPHPMSPDHTTSITLMDVSRDGTLVAYGVRRGGEDELSIRFFDVEARRDLPHEMPRNRYWDFAITPDKQGVYYTMYTKEGPRVHHHRLGDSTASDREIFGKGYGADKGIDLELSADGRHLLVTIYHGWARTDLFLVDPAQPERAVPLITGVDARSRARFAGRTIYIWTTLDAPNGRIVAVDLADPGRERWRPVIPETSAVIEDFLPAAGKLVIHYLQNATSRLVIANPDGAGSSPLDLPALGSVDGMSGRWDEPEIFFEFASFHIPPTIYRYHPVSGGRGVWAAERSPIDPERFVAHQIWYRSKDGTRVPMFLVHRRGIPLDGNNPTLLYGYGGFSNSLTPWFSQRTMLWIERGGIFAVPNLRGGGEFGEAWHRAGMLDQKQNVFDDFLAAAGWLVQHRYTKPSRLAISGGSNGGLLVGAALTQRPDLFGAVICSYPLLDMVRYHRFLVAKLWVPEYGSADNPDQFKFLHAYSPYHRVTPGIDYPAVLFITGDSDTRVDPLHARKMAALLQAPGARRPVLLHYDTKAGHSGGTPITKRIDDLADELSFLFWQLDVAP